MPECKACKAWFASVMPGDLCPACEIALKRLNGYVAPVRHGRWEFLGPNRLVKECMCGTCSACKIRSKYITNIGLCPNCGAKMDTWIYRICSQCGEEKEVCCLVDDEPWCAECFERALGNGEEKD